jgi:hypothetical protein
MTNTLSPPAPNDWVAAYPPVSGDLATYATNAFEFLAQPPYLRVAQGTTQSIPSSTWTGLILDTQIELNNGQWENPGLVTNQFQASQAGRYAVTLAFVAVLSGSTTLSCGIMYRLAGQWVGPVEFRRSVQSNSPGAVNCYDEVYLFAGDLIVPQCWASSAVSTFASGSIGNNSSLEIAWIGE